MLIAAHITVSLDKVADNADFKFPVTARVVKNFEQITLAADFIAKQA